MNKFVDESHGIVGKIYKGISLTDTEVFYLDYEVNDDTGIIERATIAKDGKLTERYAYLQDYLEGKE